MNFVSNLVNLASKPIVS